jgi:arsenical-resistance protein 2
MFAHVFSQQQYTRSTSIRYMYNPQLILLCLASSKGRGTRAAGWFADYIEDQEDDQMKSVALAEGIKGWATAGAQYVQQMIEYDANAWLPS